MTETNAKKSAVFALRLAWKINKKVFLAWVFASVALSVLPAIVLFVSGIILASFAQSLGETIIKVIYWSVGTTFSAAVLALGLCLLRKYGLKWFEFIGENKPKKKSNTNGLTNRRLMK
mgnify:CR=1 FL=1